MMEVSGEPRRRAIRNEQIMLNKPLGDWPGLSRAARWRVGEDKLAEVLEWAGLCRVLQKRLTLISALHDRAATQTLLRTTGLSGSGKLRAGGGHGRRGTEESA